MPQPSELIASFWKVIAVERRETTATAKEIPESSQPPGVAPIRGDLVGHS
jgi:hypothetical protein